VSAVFADTSFYLALLRGDDPVHSRALAESRAGHSIITTEFILLELGNACARATDHADFLALVAGLRASPRATIVPLGSQLLEQGMQLMGERQDKDWSLTDCVSFVVMREHGIHGVLTTDKHFEQAGFTTLLKQGAD
jgi:hypothetical protein